MNRFVIILLFGLDQFIKHILCAAATKEPALIFVDDVLVERIITKGAFIDTAATGQGYIAVTDMG